MKIWPELVWCGPSHGQTPSSVKRTAFCEFQKCCSKQEINDVVITTMAALDKEPIVTTAVAPETG
jgi:hypothetical protein